MAAPTYLLDANSSSKPKHPKPITYLLDANVFIEAARRYYAFDLAPGFWDSLIQHAANGRIMSIDRVKDELDKSKDALADWANKNFRSAFHSTDDEGIIQTYGRIMAWVQSQAQFLDAAKSDFAAGADGWLVACARVKGHIVVTHEVPARDARRRVPIPNVCEAFGVRWVDTFVMLRSLGVRFGTAP